MADFLPGYTGQSFPQNPKPAPSSPEEKLISMRELLSDDMLGMLMRLIQGGVKTPPAAPQWNNLHQMPGAIPPGIPGVNGAMPMRPAEPPRFPTMMTSPGFVRG